MPWIGSTSITVVNGVAEWQPSEFPVVKSVAIEVLEPTISAPRRVGYLSTFEFPEVSPGRFIRIEEGLGSVWVGGTVFNRPQPRLINGLVFRRSARLRESMIVVFHLFS